MNIDQQFLAWIEEAHTRASQHQRMQLPPPPANLIGRTLEQAVLLQHLHTPDHRLVTLVGPGGMGKTTLAVHTSAAINTDHDPAFADGAAVVLLAAIAHASDVPVAIADALGYSFQSARPTADQLIEALHGRAMLLVLDNVEHLLGPENSEPFVEFVTRLLAGAPNLHLLLTSRERLRLRDEWILELGGLAVPAADNAPKIEQTDAVRLFVERGQRSNAGFVLTANNRPAVARICRRLEGMPLAIELAATWVRAMTAAEIAAELDRALDLLSHDGRDLPARHRSVRATLDHSWNMLDANEQRALARLSVFASGCERDAAQTITGATLPTITALIDKSLVRAEGVDGVSRYRLHPLVQHYAAEHLANHPEDQHVTAERHADYYASLSGQAIDQRTGGSTPENRAMLDRNIDNLRAAWTHALATHNFTALSMLMRAFWMLNDDHGRIHEGVRVFGEATKALRDVEGAAALRGYLLGIQGYFLTRVARYDEARHVSEEALAMLQANGITNGLAIVLLHHGISLCHGGWFDQATGQLRQASQLAQAAYDQFVHLWAEFWLVLIATFQGDYATAQRYPLPSSAVFRQLGYKRGQGTSCAVHGEIARCGGRFDEASSYLREGLHIGSAATDTLTIGTCLCQLGGVAFERGELAEARYMLQESAEIMRDLGDPWLTGRALTFLARVELRRGEIEAARLACVELARIALNGEAMLLGDATLDFALLLHHAGNHAEAWALLQRFHSIQAKAELRPIAAQLQGALERGLPTAQRAAAVAAAQSRMLDAWLHELATRAITAATSASAATPKTSQTSGTYISTTGETLSPREVDVLRLIANGADNATIAQQLVVSIHTVKTHVAHILAKLDVASRTAAALRARELGLA